MKIRKLKYKHSPDITSILYKNQIGNHKFEANIFDGDEGELAGELTGKIKRYPVISKSDATLEDWIDEAMEMSVFYHNLVDFLKEVKHHHTNRD